MGELFTTRAAEHVELNWESVYPQRESSLTEHAQQEETEYRAMAGPCAPCEYDFNTHYLLYNISNSQNITIISSSSISTQDTISNSVTLLQWYSNPKPNKIFKKQNNVETLQIYFIG